MRSISVTKVLVASLLLIIVTASSLGAADYDRRFVKNYPPGYYGMWYFAQRFFDVSEEGKTPEENYRWDKYMGRMTDVQYPFYPIPFDWDYGTRRAFNLPDYNSNDWP